MAISVVQYNQSSVGGSLYLTLTPGNTLVACIYMSGAGASSQSAISGITTGGSAGNWAMRRRTISTTGYGYAGIWTCHGISGGYQDTVVSATNQGTRHWMWLFEVSGTIDFTAFTVNGNYSNSSASWSTASAPDPGIATWLTFGIAGNSGGWNFSGTPSGMTNVLTNNTHKVAVGWGTGLGPLTGAWTDSTAAWDAAIVCLPELAITNKSATETCTGDDVASAIPEPKSDSDTSAGIDVAEDIEYTTFQSASETAGSADQIAALETNGLGIRSVTAWTIVSSGTTVNAASTVNVANGTLLLAAIVSAMGADSVTDSLGNTWTKARPGNSADIYWHAYTAPASGVQVTLNQSSGKAAIRIYEVQGADNSAPFSGAGVAPHTSSQTVAVNYTSTGSNSMGFLIGGDLNQRGTPSCSDGTVLDTASSSGISCITAYKFFGAPAAQTMSITAAAASPDWWVVGAEILDGPAVTTTYAFEACAANEAASVISPVSDTETVSTIDTGDVDYSPVAIEDGYSSETIDLTADTSDVDVSTATDADSLAVEVSDSETGASDEFADVDRGLRIEDTDSGSAVDVVSPDRDLGDGEASISVEAGSFVAEYQDSEAVTSVDDIDARWIEFDEPVSAFESEELIADTTDVESAVSMDEDYPIGIVSTDTADAADAVFYMDYSYKFCPPSIEGWRDREHPLFRRIPHPVSVGVFKIDGLYRQIETPGDQEYDAATEVYLGGHDTVVHQATADALTAAGYGDYLTRF